MLSQDERFALSYNGEIYNFEELKLELKALRPSVPLAQRH